jgi:uncharacterized protein
MSQSLISECLVVNMKQTRSFVISMVLVGLVGCDVGSKYDSNQYLTNTEITTQDEKIKGGLKDLFKLAKEGVAQAQGNLAKEFYDGVLITQNDDKALYWAKLAHEGGDSLGTLLYSRMAFYGEGMQQNREYAIELMQTIQNQRIEAKYILGRMYLDTDELTPEIVIKGSTLIEEAANNGFAAAQYDHGMSLLDGLRGSQGKINESISKSVQDSALDYISMAASQDFIPAVRQLGLFYLSGYGHIAKNEQIAKTYLEQASHKGDPIASGCLLKNECGVMSK